jgi:hypothetical protein
MSNPTSHHTRRNGGLAAAVLALVLLATALLALQLTPVPRLRTNLSDLGRELIQHFMPGKRFPDPRRQVGPAVPGAAKPTADAPGWP